MDRVQFALYHHATAYGKIRYGIVANARWCKQMILPKTEDTWVALISQLSTEDILALFRAMTEDITVSWGTVHVSDSDSPLDVTTMDYVKLVHVSQLHMMLRKTERKWFTTGAQRIIALYLCLFVGSRVNRCASNVNYVNTLFNKTLEFIRNPRSSYNVDDELYRGVMRFLNAFLQHAAETDALLLKDVLRREASLAVAAAFKQDYDGESVVIPQPDQWVRRMTKSLQVLYIEQLTACTQEFYDTFNAFWSNRTASTPYLLDDEAHVKKAKECCRILQRKCDVRYVDGYYLGEHGTPFLELKYNDVKSVDFMIGYRNGMIDGSTLTIHADSGTSYDSNAD